MAPTPRWGLARLPGLDGLRGVAVAAVLLYHAGHLEGGYLGVDLFFVLSGFLITSLLLAEHGATGAIDLGAFWARRLRRLLPALLVLLVAVAAYAQVLARPVDLEDLRADGLATLFYVANWRTILDGTSYWDLSLAPSPLQHTWSLAIEEQFYLLWPPVVALVAWRRGGDLVRTVGRTALALAVASTVTFFGLRHLGVSETRLYEGTDTRATALLLGVALAAYRPVVARRVPGRVREGAGAAAAVALGLMWLFLDGTSPWLYRGGLPLASLLGVVVVGAICTAAVPPLPAPGGDLDQGAAGPGGTSALGRVLSVAPLRGLGLISYGLYLWHWPIYVVVDQRNGAFPLLGGIRFEGAALLAVKLSLSLMAALVSYRLVERPIRRGAWPGRAMAAAAAAGTALVAGLLVMSTTGAVTPLGGDLSAESAAVVVDGPTVLFAGDSVATSVVGAVVRDPVRYGIRPLNQTAIGCSVMGRDHEVWSFAGERIEPPPCPVAPRVEGHPEPDVVFLHLGARPNDAIVVEGENVRACDPRYDEVFRSEVTEMLRALTPGGRPSVVATIPRSGARAMPLRGSDERIACVNRVLGQVVAAVPGAHLLDMDRLICPDPGPCREEMGGDPIRSDGLHYDDGPGGFRVVEWVVEQVRSSTGV